VGQLRANRGNWVIWPHLLHLFCFIQILPSYFKFIICINYMFQILTCFKWDNWGQIGKMGWFDLIYCIFFASYRFCLHTSSSLFVLIMFQILTRFKWDNWGQIGEMGWFDLIYCIFFASYRFCLHTSSSLFVLNLCSKKCLLFYANIRDIAK